MFKNARYDGFTLSRARQDDRFAAAGTLGVLAAGLMSLLVLIM